MSKYQGDFSGILLKFPCLSQDGCSDYKHLGSFIGEWEKDQKLVFNNLHLFFLVRATVHEKRATGKVAKETWSHHIYICQEREPKHSWSVLPWRQWGRTVDNAVYNIGSLGSLLLEPGVGSLEGFGGHRAQDRLGGRVRSHSLTARDER